MHWTVWALLNLTLVCSCGKLSKITGRTLQPFSKRRKRRYYFLFQLIFNPMLESPPRNTSLKGCFNSLSTKCRAQRWNSQNNPFRCLSFGKTFLFVLFYQQFSISEFNGLHQIKFSLRRLSQTKPMFNQHLYESIRRPWPSPVVLTDVLGLWYDLNGMGICLNWEFKCKNGNDRHKFWVEGQLLFFLLCVGITW